MRSRWRSLTLVALLLAAPRGATADDDDDDKPAKSDTSACLLGKAEKGTIVTETSRETCGSGGCSSEESVVVYDAKENALIGVNNQEGDFDHGPSFAIDCDGGAVRVDGNKVSVTFTYDEKRRRLQFPAAVRKKIERARAAPAKGEEAAGRERLAELLEAVVDKPPAPNEVPGTPIDGVDYAAVQSLWVSVARDKIEAGDWDAGEATVLSRLTPPPPLPPQVAGQLAALRARLVILRRDAVPIAVTARNRIGSTLGWPSSPLDPDFTPGIFWRNGSICVAQEDRKPATEMRCLDPETRKWAPREPLDKPRSSGEKLRWLSYPNVDRCFGDYVVQKSVPESQKSVCGGAPGEERGALVAVVDGDALLLESGPGLRLNRGPKKNQSQNVTWQQAAALLPTSAGTYLAGDGCCRFLPDGRLARLGKSEKRWDIRGDPPKGQHWTGVPLVSPAQTWAVAFSKGDAPAVTLWLLGLKRR